MVSLITHYCRRIFIPSGMSAKELRHRKIEKVRTNFVLMHLPR